MRKLFVTIFIVIVAALVLVQSEDPPPTVGPAAEAMISDIEITMDQPETIASAGSDLK